MYIGAQTVNYILKDISGMRFQIITIAEARQQVSLYCHFVQDLESQGTLPRRLVGIQKFNNQGQKYFAFRYLE